MKAACENCGTEHVLRDAEVAAHKKVQFHCSKCKHTTIVEIQLRPDQTMVVSPLPSFARATTSELCSRSLSSLDRETLPMGDRALWEDKHVMVCIFSSVLPVPGNRKAEACGLLLSSEGEQRAEQ